MPRKTHKVSLIYTQPWFADALGLWFRHRNEWLIGVSTLWTSESTWPLESEDMIRILILAPQTPLSGHCLRAMAQDGVAIPTVVMASWHDELWMKIILRDGVVGYLTPEQSFDDFQAALQHLVSGETFIPQRYIKALMTRTPATMPHMSNREKLIARLLVDGHSHQEIADQLHISVKTVSSHKNNLLMRLNLKGLPDLVRLHDRHPFAFMHSNTQRKRNSTTSE